ncbi:MAG: hypothetical protein K2I05_06905 [Mailhella sp.]|nr:hypothetical protein [Mailhella sp.]
MDAIYGLLETKFLNMLLMFAVCFGFIFFLRLLYGPRGIFRKKLWKNTEEKTHDK